MKFKTRTRLSKIALRCLGPRLCSLEATTLPVTPCFPGLCTELSCLASQSRLGDSDVMNSANTVGLLNSLARLTEVFMVLSMWLVGGQIGTVFGMPMSGLLCEWFGWESVFYFFGENFSLCLLMLRIVWSYYFLLSSQYSEGEC